MADIAQSLLDIKKAPVETVVGSLLAKDDHEASRREGLKLLRTAAKFNVNIRDYLTIAVDTRNTEYGEAKMSGYEAALAHLNLPVRDNFQHGVMLQAASETFETYPGTRILFPPVLDDVLRFQHRQDNIQTVEPMLAGSRTISGNEMLMTIASDSGNVPGGTSEFASQSVTELSRIPVRTIRTSEYSVKMYKHGSGIRTSYEFNRRARLDILTPFAARVARELELGKVAAATAVIINGDLPSTAAPVVAQASFTAQVGTATLAGVLSYQHILAWMVARAKAAAPIDTIIGNYDGLFQWMRLFIPINANVLQPAAVLGNVTGTALSYPRQFFPANMNFVISSAVPANQLVGITKNETLEEMKEAGGDIAEQEREMLNQSITYLRTEVSGYRLLFRDTRQVLDYSAAG